jgi:hypothetical protein
MTDEPCPPRKHVPNSQILNEDNVDNTSVKKQKLHKATEATLLADASKSKNVQKKKAHMSANTNNLMKSVGITSKSSRQPSVEDVDDVDDDMPLNGGSPKDPNAILEANDGRDDDSMDIYASDNDNPGLDEGDEDFDDESEYDVKIVEETRKEELGKCIRSTV